ncbi:hypothetical protein [Kitasatospora sp. A2-31]|uniref:hypothetical protein n=1 Tax=Kitasatospora sp. A2-31 TaxID=2916414 RepID=UPI001EE9F8D1|nr:hypothetical protein [Kitasatospora sp. A2-31]MCG6494383.1 hypothetical protein [Kitasatospora sp. A2-31]
MTMENTVVVGVRSAEEVFGALEEVDARRRPFTGYEQGLLEAYRWAVGTRSVAPVTAAATAGPLGPCRAQLLAECQAAAVAIRTGADRSETARVADDERMLGLYAGLAWLCGHHDDRP